MKKITIVLIFIFLSVLFSGCNNSYKPVYSIKFTTAEKTITLTSSISEKYNETYLDIISKYQYDNKLLGDYPYEEELSQPFCPTMTKSYKIPKEHKGQTTWTLDYDPPKVITYYNTYGGGNYYIRSFTTTQRVYSIIYLKIIDNKTLSIKKGESETIYTVTSYSVTDFS